MSWRVRSLLCARAATRAARPRAPVCAALRDARQHRVVGREQTRESAPRVKVFTNEAVWARGRDEASIGEKRRDESRGEGTEPRRDERRVAERERDVRPRESERERDGLPRERDDRPRERESDVYAAVHEKERPRENHARAGDVAKGVPLIGAQEERASEGASAE